MSTNIQVPQDHPLMRAWNAFKSTPEYANSKSWAQHAEHVDGSLWALFMAGWMAAEAELRREVKQASDILKPCPFCGGEARMKQDAERYRWLCDKATEQQWVKLGGYTVTNDIDDYIDAALRGEVKP